MPIKKSVTLTETAENTGYKRVWTGEDIHHRDIFTYLSIISLNTTDIMIASGITSAYVRMMPVIINSCKALIELSNDRFDLGIGTGGLPEVERFIGSRPIKSLKFMEGYAEEIKKRLDLQIYMGVRGPRMLELAGRLADGVILSGPKGYIEKAVEIIDRSSKGRRVKKILWNAFYLGENPKLVSNITSTMLESMPDFALQYMDPKNAEHELCIYGEGEKILEEIEDYIGMGITELVIGPPYGKDPIKVLEEVGDIFGVGC